MRQKARSKNYPQQSEWHHGILMAGFGVSTGTGLFWFMRDVLGKGHAALLYLPVVVIVASIGGTRAGLIAAFLSFFSWNFFFLTPYYTFIIHDPKDWISLFVFLLVGTAMGLQTGRIRERESEAREREEESSLLYRLSAQLTAQTDNLTLATTLLNEVTETLVSELAILFLPDDKKQLYVFKAQGPQPISEETERLAEWVYAHMKAIGLPVENSVHEQTNGRWPVSVAYSDLPEAYRTTSTKRDDIAPGVFIPLHATLQAEGVLFAGQKNDGSDFTPRDARLLISISQLAAALLERQRLQNEAAQAEALREGDRLKSTLISSVSHELKTPLASVTARITSLLETDVDWQKQELREELQAVAEDLERLHASIGDLLDLSRLEAGAWEPKQDWHELGEILGTVISRFPHPQRMRINFQLPDGLPLLYVDYAQLAKAIHNLLENALLYSPKDTEVRVGADLTGHEIHIWVEDRGPGVSSDERQRIFQKFHRGSASATVPSGTGLGLAIAAEIVRFHHGRIHVESAVPHGARFVISLLTKDSSPS